MAHDDPIGCCSEALRLAQIQSWMYPVYVLHLVLILTLFLYTPYSKFAHFIYRTLALAVTWHTNKPLLGTQESVAAGRSGADRVRERPRH